MAKKFLTGIDLQNQRIVNLADPSSATDGVTKQYVDNLLAGLQWKQPVRAATTANITLSATQTIDGVALVAGDRVLVKNQTTASENGIYVVASGAWARATDADTAGELVNATVMVSEGTVNGDSAWTQTANAPLTVNTTALSFAQFGGGGASYSAGNGLTLSGTTFAVGAGTGILSSPGSISIDPSVVARKFSTNVGNGSDTSIAVTHNLGTKDVIATLYNSTTFESVEVDWTITDTNTVTFTFAVAPTANAYRAVIIG